MAKATLRKGEKQRMWAQIRQHSGEAKWSTASQITFKHFISATASGTNTYTATLDPSITAYTNKLLYFIEFTNASTAASTLNLNSVGAKKIYIEVKGVITQAANKDIYATMKGILMYDSSLDGAVGGFVILNKRDWFELVTNTNISANKLLRINYGDPALSLYLADETGGQRISIWDGSVALPINPHTGIISAFSVYGDLVVGDISTFSPPGNAYIVGDRTTTGLHANTDITHFMCSNTSAGIEPNCGAMVDLYPTETDAASAARGGPATANDGIAEIIAYGRGTAALANNIIFANRSATNTVTRRWVINNSGHLVPFASAVYNIGVAGYAVKSIIAGAGTGTGEGYVPVVIENNSASGLGSPADTNENTLKTYTMPANTLVTNGDVLKITCYFRCAGNTTTKRIQVYFGATVIADSTVIANNNKIIIVEAMVVRTGATAQIAYAKAISSTKAQAWGTALEGGLEFTAPAETLTGAIVVKSTVTLGAGAALNDVIQDAFIVEYLRKG